MWPPKTPPISTRPQTFKDTFIGTPKLAGSPFSTFQVAKPCGFLSLSQCPNWIWGRTATLVSVFAEVAQATIVSAAISTTSSGFPACGSISITIAPVRTRQDIRCPKTKTPPYHWMPLPTNHPPRCAILSQLPLNSAQLRSFPLISIDRLGSAVFSPKVGPSEHGQFGGQSHLKRKEV